jgi:ceramide glucosyltransferase
MQSVKGKMQKGAAAPQAQFWNLPFTLCILYALDRLLRLLALRAFFGRPSPSDPGEWPAISLIQPITRATHDLRAALASRAGLSYPGPVQHLVVCDEADSQSQRLARQHLAALPAGSASLLTVPPDGGAIASKITKLNAALPHASGAVLCFLDDDVSLPPDGLQTLVRHLGVPGVGATFGLAHYSAWETPWSSLMSLFVNSWALPSYVPLSMLTEPYTITGHCFAVRRAVFDRAGGFDRMEQRIDDDHELARRVRAIGLRCEQTPLLYAVENRLASARAYHAQLRRWFVFPRQTMLPQLTRRERLVSALGSIGNFLPPLAALAALVSRRRPALVSAAACLGLFLASNEHVRSAYLRERTPWRRAPLLLVTALFTPLHLIAASLSSDVVEWRGQRLRVRRGGEYEVL